MSVLNFQLPVDELTSDWLLEWGDDACADIAFVAEHVCRVERVEDSGLPRGLGVVNGSWQRVGYVGEPSVEGDDELVVVPGGVVLPEYSSGWEAHDQHGSRDPSTTVAVPRTASSRSGTQSSRASAIAISMSAMALETVD